MARPRRPSLVSLLVVAVLLLVGVPLASGGATHSPASGEVAHRPLGSPAPESGLGPSTLAPAPPLSCLSIPRGAPCFAAGDQPVVDLLSNASGSGARFSLLLNLPAGGTTVASALASFWVGLWVTGAPCSVDGASYLRVVLYPPYSPSVSPASPNWTVRAPVDDLVPAGSCDPLCQNATAVATLGGVPVCEDNIVLGGGALSVASVGHFAPGDQLRITAWGQVGGPLPLNVWANDTTNPSQSASWNYGGTATTTGQPVLPRFDVSNASDGGWSTPSDVAFGWSACPAIPGLGACNSYDGPAVAAVGLPTVSGAEFWNTSSAALEAVPWLATASTSGGCSGAPSLPTCSNYAGFGGTGSYPTLAIVRTAVGAAWRLGGSANVVAGFGGAAAEFAANGSTTTVAPGIVLVGSSNGSAGVATVNTTVADPRGVVAVRISAYWCTGAGPALVQAQTLAGPSAGTFTNVSVALNVSSEDGPLTYWLSERSNGSVWTPPVSHTLTMTGGSGTCTVPPPPAPGFGAANVTAASGGYRLDWSENAGGIVGFTVAATPIGGGTTVVQRLGNVGGTKILGLLAADHYNLTVTVLSLTGASNASSNQPALPPLPPLVVTLGTPNGPVWHAGGSTPFGVTIAGGVAPFEVEVALANGTAIFRNTSANATTIPVSLGPAVGLVVVRVMVRDSNGVVGAATPIAPDVWAGPLAPGVAANAGDGFVGVQWSPSLSPVAPVDHYVVFLTANASGAFGEFRAGTTNTTPVSPLGAIEVWNTTNNSVSVPWPDNSTAFALVVPVNSFGHGFASPVPLAATPAPLTPGPIAGGPGGPAPYQAQFATLVGTGTNDSIDQAIYSFPGFRFVTANLTRVSPTEVWMNASVTISTLGLTVVLLHASDSFGATVIQSTYLWVTAGAAPSVSAQANPAPAYVGVLVEFRASATGIGPFSYVWSFGDGTNQTGGTANHSYATSGTFTATVAVTDGGTGATAVAVVPETVYALPRVAIVTSAGPNGSNSFAFHAELLGGSGSGTFVWAFGDGEVAHGENVTHDYRSAGPETVNVTATDASLRTAFSYVTILVPSSAGGSGGSSGAFTPLAEVLLAVAVAGWLLAGVLLLRARARARLDDDEDEFDED
jgi:hypothetical protein